MKITILKNYRWRYSKQIYNKQLFRRINITLCYNDHFTMVTDSLRMLIIADIKSSVQKIIICNGLFTEIVE